jgi:protein tyrosine phosphatase (PTP) superfamily phosphohydrolase (DUF442 family)
VKRFRIFSLWMAFWAVAPGIHAQASAPAAMQSAYGEKIHIDGVPHAGKINEHLYRGAQPKPTAMAELKKMGITTVVDLRGEDNQTMNAERAEAEAQGLHFVNIPVGRFSSPTNEQVVQFLSLFRDHPDQTVFVHWSVRRVLPHDHGTLARAAGGKRDEIFWIQPALAARDERIRARLSREAHVCASTSEFSENSNPAEPLAGVAIIACSSTKVLWQRNV